MGGSRARAGRQGLLGHDGRTESDGFCIYVVMFPYLDVCGRLALPGLWGILGQLAIGWFEFQICGGGVVPGRCVMVEVLLALKD